MLQVIDLVKRYTTKGETVTALGGVSVDFPERGMVFLLGKSGSGKSTLLNIAGGLDAPDEGEVIVRGKSSKDFSASDFDSYRNTYVGFIFQEYNILNELTVAENIALAIELQGKSRDKATVERILSQVDLEGLGDRHPNTLSGGQKQRVAIARALVKSPEIIMADEPTGALDSATGKQVFDTLKKLSKEKLVVVVSHDREFAENYADRIIELKDGLIISDVTRGEDAVQEKNLRAVGDKTLSVSSGAALTEEEISRIVTFLKNSKGGVMISSNKEETAKVVPKAGFAPTPVKKIEREPENGTFIKSHFPLQYAFKMAVSGLRCKPVRLVFTIILSTIAFLIFGIFSTISFFREGKVAAVTLYDSSYNAAVLRKENGTSALNANFFGNFLEEEIEGLKEEYPSEEIVPVFTFGATTLSFRTSLARNNYPAEGGPDAYHDVILEGGFTGFADAECLDNDNFSILAGRKPQAVEEGLPEIALSKEVFEVFRSYAYKANELAAPTPIDTYESLLGKSISVWIGSATSYVSMEVVGIVECYDDFSAYDFLKAAGNYQQGADELLDCYEYSFSSIAFVGENFYERFRDLDYSITYYRQNQELYHSPRYKEESESLNRYQYLFAPLHADRAQTAELFMVKLRGYSNAAEDYHYSTPYAFIAEIMSGKYLIRRINSVLGPVAVILAVFSALLLFNFISASINAKKKDIGILRAVGARGIDVFKIFIFEALLITMLCYALACLGAWGACFVVNDVLIASKAVSFKLFLFDWANALTVLPIAFLTALVSTGFPVFFAVRKKPVEAIRTI